MAAPAGPEPSAEAYPALWPVPTRWSDDNRYGLVDSVAYYSYFDTAVTGWLMASTGLDIRELPAIGVVAESSCRFLRDLAFPDQVHVGLSVEHLGTSSIVYSLAIFREDPDAGLELTAIGRLVHVYVDTDDRRPTPVPPEIRSAALLLTVSDD